MIIVPISTSNPNSSDYAHLVSTVRKSFTKARVLLKSMNKFNDELCALYALPKLTKVQIKRRDVVEMALLELDGYLRDGGGLPNSEYVKMANQKAA